MRCYRTIGGELVATQAEAGKGHERADVPDNKADLLAFINAERGRAAPRAAAEPIAAPVVPAAAGAGDRCPACSRTPAGAEKIARSMDAGAVAERILQADGFELSRMFEAMIDRLGELGRKLP
jgi:hypothetical protein